MLTAVATPQSLDTPINVLEHILDSGKKAHTIDIPPTIARIIVSVTSQLEKERKLLNALTPHKAKRFLPIVDQMLPHFLAIFDEWESLKGDCYTAETQLVDGLLAASRQFIAEIIYIANGRTVDENSPGFVSFLADMVKEDPACKNGEFVTKEALLAMLD